MERSDTRDRADDTVPDGSDQLYKAGLALGQLFCFKSALKDAVPVLLDLKAEKSASCSPTVRGNTALETGCGIRTHSAEVLYGATDFLVAVHRSIICLFRIASHLTVAALNSHKSFARQTWRLAVRECLIQLRGGPELARAGEEQLGGSRRGQTRLRSARRRHVSFFIRGIF